MSLPWWIHVLLSILCYCAIKYGLPYFKPEIFASQESTRFLSTAAPLGAIAFLLLAAKRLYDPTPPDTASSLLPANTPHYRGSHENCTRSEEK